ncbi:hypothetical protein Acr_00g0002930 [Actinidia rufa]|uniref:Uncharacterized protein n=1 Tax=Actinidia rufa TaxID=165716 RepID=A0A7J0D8T4_9ERIC|nr:hypothetical protein Acr_00g0002930 [Actinidia rufa]
MKGNSYCWLLFWLWKFLLCQLLVILPKSRGSARPVAYLCLQLFLFWFLFQQVQIVIATTCPTLTERKSNGSFFLTSDGSVRLGSLRKEVRASSSPEGLGYGSPRSIRLRLIKLRELHSKEELSAGDRSVGTQAAGSRGEAQNPFPGSYYMRWPFLGTSKEDFEPQQQKKTLAQDSVERWKGKVPTEVSLFLLPFFLELAPQRPGVLFHRFMYGEEGNGWFYDELFARGVSEDTIRLRNEIWGSSLLTRCQIVRRRKTGLSLISEPVAMVDNLRAEGGDNAETERTLAERLHKLTTLENKEVMSDSKIDRESCLIQSRTLKLHFPTFEEIGPVVFLEQKNSLHTIKVKRRIDVDFLP